MINSSTPKALEILSQFCLSNELEGTYIQDVHQCGNKSLGHDKAKFECHNGNEVIGSCCNPDVQSSQPSAHQ
jgi:hypothetical protein